MPSQYQDARINNAYNIFYANSSFLKNWMPIEGIMGILEIILKNDYLCFCDAIYQQIQGLPTGSSLSGVLASLYVDTIQRITINSISSTISIYRRYVDDVFAVVQNRDGALATLWRCDRALRLCHWSHSLRNYSGKKKIYGCRMKSCTIKDDTICHKWLVVYKITCACILQHFFLMKYNQVTSLTL